jgi:cell division protease FtsH
MTIRKIKFFLMLHWVKILIIGSVLLLLLLSYIGLRSLESFYRHITLAQMPVNILLGGVHAAIFVFFLYWLHYGGGFAKLQKTPIHTESVNVHWEDVIGIEEAKEEAWEVVQLLKDRSGIQRVGGKILRGILMVGPPGCGKTYLAKAIATEARLPFISMSGSEFVEIFVGVGASRVRKLFKMASKYAYGYGGCIVFIDELDAVGRKRVFSVFGGTEETNSTQNQLLAEMDGLQDKDFNILVIGATNAVEGTLDEALLRPGRFDRKIYINPPGLEGREKIFRYYLSKVKSDPTIDVGRLARKTVHKTPADIANIVREATLIAARVKRNMVTFKELSEAIERIDMGIKQKRTLTEKERKMVAYHEAGHLIVMYILHPTDDVFKASIVSRRASLGQVYSQPREEFFTSNRDRLLANIKVALGGYVAEKLKLGTTSDGVISDFQSAMRGAHNMVWKFGMGAAGLLGDYTTIPESQLSETVKERLNSETQQIIQNCMQDVEKLLSQESVLLDRFAKELLEKEELEYDEIEAIFKEYGKAHAS